MLRTKTLRAAFLLPAAMAIALVSQSRPALADDAMNILLKAQIKAFGLQEGKTDAAAGAVTTATASADDLVYAVYEVIKTNPSFTSAQLADVIDGALRSVTVGNKVYTRADKDKISGRIIEAAIIASGSQTNPANVGAMVAILGTINGGTTKALTVAGKELAVSKALRATQSMGATIATNAESLIVPTGTATDAQRSAFIVAVAKGLAFLAQTNDSTVPANKGTYFPVPIYPTATGNSAPTPVPVPVVGEPPFVEAVPSSIIGPTSNVVDFIDKEFDLYSGVADRQTIAVSLAQGVSTIPSVAGAILGGYAKDLKARALLANPATGAATADAAIVTFLHDKVVGYNKLAGVVGEAVAASFRNLETTTNAQKYADDVTTLATSTTAAVKGSIASGAIRAAGSNSTMIIPAILGVIDAKPITQKLMPAFASAAAVGNSQYAPGIFSQVLSAYLPTTAATEVSKIETIASAVINSVSLTSPEAADLVAQEVFAITRTAPVGSTAVIVANPFIVDKAHGGDAVRAALAGVLAKAASKNYTAAGAAVAGVVNATLKLDYVTNNDAGALNQVTDITPLLVSAIRSAPKAATSIVYRTTSDPAVQKAFGNAQGTAQSLAEAVAGNSAVSGNYAGAIAAGAALTDTKNSGAIAAAVISVANGKNNKLALSIANTVASQVDVEAVGLIARDVGALFQVGAGVKSNKLPKTSSLGAFATSLGKAIESKPMVLWQNRVDELNELAATLVNVAISKGVTDAKSFATIGTSIYKAVSAKLIANAGNFGADLSDIAQGVAGAIAQTIASSTNPLLPKDTLLSGLAGTRNSLLNLLSTGAKTATNKAAVQLAFTQVLSAKVGATYNIYTGPAGATTTNKSTDANGQSQTSVYELGATYETTGNVSDPETRIKNI